MSEAKPIEINGEIDLREIFLALWRGKYIIFSMSVLAIVFSSMHLRNSERKYSVELIFKPVVETSGNSNLSGFSGLASLAGVSLPTSSSADFTTYQRLLFSEEVAKRVFVNEKLMTKLFKGEWNSDSASFVAPPIGGKINEFKKLVRSALIGVGDINYIPPNPKRLSLLMAATFEVSLDSATGFLLISTETNEPNIMIELISNASQETDNLLKERFFATAEETLEFYYQKLLTSRSPEHREALAKLISAEDQKLMLASKGSNFVAEPLTMPSVSLYPTSPKSRSVLTLGVILGIFLGAAIVLVRYVISKPRAA